MQRGRAAGEEDSVDLAEDRQQLRLSLVVVDRDRARATCGSETVEIPSQPGGAGGARVGWRLLRSAAQRAPVSTNLM